MKSKETLVACYLKNVLTWLIHIISEKVPPDIDVSVTLSYLSKNCNEQDPIEVQKKFFRILELVMQQFMAQYCTMTGCKPENINVKCGKKDDGRRKRSAQISHRLEIDFQMKIPFPKNQSIGINKTVENVQSSFAQSLNKSASTVEVGGEKLKLERPPTVQFTGLNCKDGYVLNSDSCGEYKICVIIFFTLFCCFLKKLSLLYEYLHGYVSFFLVK